MQARRATAVIFAGVAGLAPWAAQAGTFSAYGQVHAGVSHFSYDDSDSVTEVTDQGRTRVGIAGSQPLDGGWSAVGQLEWNTTPHLGDGELSRRSAYVGVDGPFGKVSLGSHHAAYKVTGGVRWDPLVTTELQQRRSGGMSGGSFGQNSFVDRSIEYISPVQQGFQVQAQLGVADDGGDGRIRDDDGDADLQAGDAIVGVSYTGLPDWELIASAIHLDEPYNDDDDLDGDTNWKLGARWAPEGYSVAYQFEDVEIIRGPSGQGRIDNLVDDAENRQGGEDSQRFSEPVHHHALIGTWEQGRNTWVLALSHTDADADEEDVSAVTGALVHQPHEDFRIYGGIQHQAFDDDIGAVNDASDDSLTTVSLGARYDFGATF